jgi:ABC-type branched-subunit amino acid transport system substrate-binding protein
MRRRACPIAIGKGQKGVRSRRRLCQAVVAASILPGAALAQRTPRATPKGIVLGQSAAFSGPAAPFGFQMNAGVKAYFNYVNAQGGINGREIELRARDDKYEASLAAENTRKLIEQDDVFALIAYVGTPTSAAALPFFTRARVPFFGPFTGAEVLRNPFNRYVFNVRASYYDETEKIVEQIVSTGSRTIAVFYQYDSYGQAGLIGVEQAMARRKMNISAAATVDRDATNLVGAVQAIIGPKPDAVIMIAGYRLVAEFVRGMKKEGYAGQFHNLSLVGAKALADALGSDSYGVAVSRVVPDPWSPTTSVVREYQGLLGAAGVKEYDFASLEGFLVAKAFTEGLRRAGRDPTPEQFITALETMADVDLGGFVINFSPSNHNGSKFVDLSMIGRNGKLIT